MNLISCAAIISIASLITHAQIVVTGIAPRTGYTDKAAFTIQSAPGYNYSATLNGFPVAVGLPITVTNASYYELNVQRTATETQTTENLVVPFVITSSERGSSETGLPPWTPLPTIPSAAAEFTGAHVEILAPENYPAEMAVPVVLWIRDEKGRRGVNGVIQADLQPDLVIRRGVGSILLSNAPGSAVQNYPISLPGLSTNLLVHLEINTAWVTNSGTILADTTWPANSRIFIPNLTVATGATLTIEAGTVIQLAPGAEIHVDGSLQARGQPRSPIIFAPASNSQPWGGIELRNANARLDLTGTILTGGGADPDWIGSGDNGSSHRDEQPILFANNGARVTLTDSALIHGSGQAGHGEQAFFTFTRTLIQGFITTGQFNGGSVAFIDSAAIEFPTDDDRFENVDNDALYLTGGAHYLTNSLFGWAKDDGIDAGSGSAGSVTMVNCWIESCFHEGLAWSEDRVVTVSGTVVLNCGQGIEAGFGAPNVLVSNSLSTANVIGTRFGDNYDWDYNGFLRVTNSLVLYNDRDVWGMTWDNWTYRSSQMDIAGTRLTQLNPNHPTNDLWNPDVHTASLVSFLPTPASSVGAAFALRDLQIHADATNVPVRLSTFTTNRASIDYVVHTKVGSTIESNYSGTLRFEPGQTVQHIPILADRLPADRELTRIQLIGATNAELSASSRAYLIPVGAALFREIIPLGSTWRYPDPSTNLGSAWRSADYDDNSWRTGASELGNGDADETTVINIGQPARFPTVYFRHAFDPDLSDPGQPLVARVKVDDGAVVYLNGQELFRVNMPAGTVTYSTLAPDTLENDWFTNTIPASALVAGTNLIAVEVHQQALDSSDLTFDFELLQMLPLKLNAVSFAEHLLLYGAGDSILEEASTVLGPWKEIQPATRNLEVTPSKNKNFYRLRTR